jgi:protein TonB
MKTLMLILISGLFSLSAFAQTEKSLEMPPKHIEDVNDDQKIYTSADVPPEYHGGESVLFGDLQKHIKYPEEAKKRNETGTVFVSFVIEKDGSVKEMKILRGVSESINNEALRVISKLPNWKPAMHNGKPVRFQFNLPIKFSLK